MEDELKKIAEKYPFLYHYTSMAGLKGILKDKNLWSTHYKFLNDTSEIEHSKHLVSKLVIDAIRRVNKETVEQSQAPIDKDDAIRKLDDDGLEKKESLYKALNNETNDMIFLTPFCIHNDDDCIHDDKHRRKNHGILSQWRGYGALGGAMIVFDTEKIINICSKFQKKLACMMVLNKVIYGSEDFPCREDLEGRNRSITDWFEKAQRAYLLGGEYPGEDEVSRNFIELATTYKHISFIEENEFRIVTLCKTEKGNEEFDVSDVIKYRDDSIPYLEIPFDGIQPISRIIIGPHANQEARINEIRHLVRDKDIQVTDSNIPLRW